jgi:uncharacterized cupredoxin-like copper-binding protein
VTNALRLRRFRRPASAAEILHPRLRARVGDYAYLVGIALVAFAIGAAALAFARSDMAARPQPAKPGTAVSADAVTRTVQVDTTDTLSFAPDQLTVRTGDTVAFEINNPGRVPHEFFIGTAAEQEAHEREMTGGTPMRDEPGQVDVLAGQIVRLLYTFDRPGTLEYGCHVAGHYAAGMRGTITATSA